eukprot:Em0003g247a
MIVHQYLSPSEMPGAAPGVQGPPPLIHPSGEHPSNGGASHRVEQQLQQIDQTDGVQHSEQRWGYGGAPIEDMRSDRRQIGEVDIGNDFPAVSGDQLGEDNLVDVIEEVMDVAARWRSVGLALRLRVAELDTISSKNHTDPTECLKDMLLAWVQQHYNINEFGPPSWKLLCQAIFKKAGGNNPALARKIAEHHRGRAH